jgi:hypothetical protein
LRYNRVFQINSPFKGAYEIINASDFIRYAYSAVILFFRVSTYGSKFITPFKLLLVNEQG